MSFRARVKTTSLISCIVLGLTMLFAILVIVVSMLPFNRVAFGTRPSSRMESDLARAHFFHITLHFLVFSTLAVASGMAAKSAVNLGFPPQVSQPVGSLSPILVGFSTEYFQSLKHHKALEWDDILTNIFSCVIVLGLISLIQRRKIQIGASPAVQLPTKNRGLD